MFAEASIGLSDGQALGFAITIITVLSGTVALLWKVSMGFVDRSFKAQEQRDGGSVKIMQAQRDELERERDKHRAEMALERERYERLAAARALDASAWREGVVVAFSEIARSSENARRAVELATTPPDAVTPMPAPPRESRPNTPQLPGEAPPTQGRQRRTSRG